MWQETNQYRHFQQAIFWSLICHLLLFTALPINRSQAKPAAVEISLLSLPVPKKVLSLTPPPDKEVSKQLVAPSAEKSVEPPKNPRFLSEHDSTTERETLHRGLPDAGNVSVRQGDNRPRQKVREKKESPAKENPRKSFDLHLSDEQLDKQVFAKLQPKPQANDSSVNILSKTKSPINDRERVQEFQKREPFGGTGFAALFQGKRGDADYLPEIPDGDITLLNAKADHFAVFVRRVALQVFGALRKLSWQELSSAEINGMNGFIDIQATMSKEGKLLDIRVLETSGSKSFDAMVVSAARIGTWDQNPPPEAATSDGNIHFLFKAKSWSRGSREGLREERWLLLGTGLL